MAPEKNIGGWMCSSPWPGASGDNGSRVFTPVRAGAHARGFSLLGK